MSYSSRCMMLATQFAPIKEYLSECANLSSEEQKHVCRWLEIILNTYCKCLSTNKCFVTLLLLYFIFALFWYLSLKGNKIGPTATWLFLFVLYHRIYPVSYGTDCRYTLYIQSIPLNSATSNNCLILTYKKKFQIKCTQCLMEYTLSDKILIMESLLWSYQG
jgi:hypothetical protein